MTVGRQLVIGYRVALDVTDDKVAHSGAPR